MLAVSYLKMKHALPAIAQDSKIALLNLMLYFLVPFWLLSNWLIPGLSKNFPE